MRIIFFILGVFLLLNANELLIVKPKSYYIKTNLSQIYIKLLAYQENEKLIEIIDYLLKNENFKKRMYFLEMGKVKVNTIDLLSKLKYFLEGWPKYSNTDFENNTNIAGIKKILKDSINNPNFINTSQNVIKDMKKSILNLEFFKIANKIEYDLSNKNFKNEKNLVSIMKNLSMLINSYVNTLSQIKEPLLTKYNKKIKDELEKDYRIYAKVSLIKIMKIFDELIKQNYKEIKNGL